MQSMTTPFSGNKKRKRKRFLLRVGLLLLTVAASLLGHTEKVNEENYTYDVSSMEEKSKFMECAGRV